MPFKNSFYDDDYQGPTEVGYDGKVYPKGRAPKKPKGWKKPDNLGNEYIDPEYGTSGTGPGWLGSSSRGKSNGNTDTLDGLFSEYGGTRSGRTRNFFDNPGEWEQAARTRSQRKAYAEAKKRFQSGGSWFTNETQKFFEEMGWWDAINHNQNMYRDWMNGVRQNVNMNYEHQAHGRSSPPSESDLRGMYKETEPGFFARITGNGTQSHGQDFAETIFKNWPDITLREAADMLHPDRFGKTVGGRGESFEKLGEEAFKHIKLLMGKRDGKVY